jgi:asparagine synthase (glutamine-hydrolysing)
MGRYTIVYNGELYNYIELRESLKKVGYKFFSNSDTEVIMAAYDYYKIKCLQYFDGMFSFALWDEAEQTLIAARDRFGEKPFYYFTEKEVFVFASEMKAIWAAGIEKEASYKMILNYITLGYVQNPADNTQTFYNDISSLPPSHYLLFRKGKLSVRNYWKIDKYQLNTMNEDEAVEKLNELFAVSVARRLRSDVPVGTSLSGGLDSSSILYYMKQFQPKDIHSFSAVFPGFEKDESRFIQTVSNHLEIINHTVTPNEQELYDDFEKLMYHHEEPIPSSSIYAQYRVFKLAKEHGIKVLLDGQGADEVLAGYHRYLHWYLQEKVNRYQFLKMRNEMRSLRKNNIKVEWGIKNYVAAYLPSHVSLALEKREYNKIAHNHDVSKDLLSLLKGREWDGIHKPVVTKLNDILCFNMMEHGIEELLRFSDRNSMAHGCEVRLPFLQHELVKFIFSLPADYKIKGGFTKHILRKLMDKKLPDEIVWRTDKIGYEPPQKTWLAAPVMQEAVTEAKTKLVQNGILNKQTLQNKIIPAHAHEEKNHDWRYLCVAKILGN